jgi:hypothetical protein
MAESTGNSGGGLYFIVGALVIAVLVIGYFAFGGSLGGGSTKKLDVTIEAPKAK